MLETYSELLDLTTGIVSFCLSTLELQAEIGLGRRAALDESEVLQGLCGRVSGDSGRS